MHVASAMTAKDNNNICKKMKLLKKISDIKCCKQEKCKENCRYEKENDRGSERVIRKYFLQSNSP